MEKNTARLQFIHLRMKIPGLFEVQFARGVARFEMAFFNDVVSWTYVSWKSLQGMKVKTEMNRNGQNRNRKGKKFTQHAYRQCALKKSASPRENKMAEEGMVLNCVFFCVADLYSCLS